MTNILTTWPEGWTVSVQPATTEDTEATGLCRYTIEADPAVADPNDVSQVSAFCQSLVAHDPDATTRAKAAVLFLQDFLLQLARQGMPADYVAGDKLEYRFLGSTTPVATPSLRRSVLAQEIQRMFERFTDTARRAIVLAQEVAREAKSDHIECVDLLVGICNVPGTHTSEWLTDLSIGCRPISNEPRAPLGHIPFTATAKTAMELALREALRRGHNFIATEHLLLGLTRTDGLPAAELSGLGIDTNTIHAGAQELARELKPATEAAKVAVSGMSLEDLAEMQQLVYGRMYTKDQTADGEDETSDATKIGDVVLMKGQPKSPSLTVLERHGGSEVRVGWYNKVTGRFETFTAPSEVFVIVDRG